MGENGKVWERWNIGVARRRNISLAASPGILKLYKGKGRPAPILEIYEGDGSVLVEQILNILRTNFNKINWKYLCKLCNFFDILCEFSEQNTQIPEPRISW